MIHPCIRRQLVPYSIHTYKLQTTAKLYSLDTMGGVKYAYAVWMNTCCDDCVQYNRLLYWNVVELLSSGECDRNKNWLISTVWKKDVQLDLVINHLFFFFIGGCK